jgi:hypothetical protein
MMVLFCLLVNLLQVHLFEKLLLNDEIVAVAWIVGPFAIFISELERMEAVLTRQEK